MKRWRIATAVAGLAAWATVLPPVTAVDAQEIPGTGNAAVITSVTPAIAVNSAPVTLTIQGSGFQPGDEVVLRRHPSELVVSDDLRTMVNVAGTWRGSPQAWGPSEFVSPSELRASFDLRDTDGTFAFSTPAAPGRWQVLVRHRGSGSNATCPDTIATGGCFEVTNPGPPTIAPKVTAVPVGALGVGMMLDGSNFAADTTVDAGADVVLHDVVITSRTRIRVDLAVASPDGGYTPAALGPRDIVVTNADGQSARCGGCLTVTPGALEPRPTMQPVHDGGDGLVVVGRVPVGPSDKARRPVAVDADRGIAFVPGRAGDRVVTWEFETGSAAARTPQGRVLGNIGSGFNPGVAIIDTKRALVLPLTNTSALIGCWSFPIYAYANSEGSFRLSEERTGVMPCTGPEGSVAFSPLGGAYDEGLDRYYMSGRPAPDVDWRSLFDIAPLPWFLDRFHEQRGQSLLVRQVRPESGAEIGRGGRASVALRLEWEIDLRHAGCGGRQEGSSGAFAQRVGDYLVAYCFDPAPYRRVKAVGEQGYVVRIPLEAGPDGVMRPRTRGEPVVDPLGPPESVANYEFTRTPTFSGPVTVFADEEARRLVLVTDDAARGQAAWVFDVEHLRMVGVVTGGVVDQPKGNTSVGFDSTTGRVYVLTAEGVLVMPTREGRLEGGQLYPVAVNETGAEGFAGTPLMAVQPRPEGARIFLPLAQDALLIDDRVRVGSPLEVDPDALTAQVDEQEGVTEVSALGAARASGAHVVVVGGASNTVNSNDPTCSVAAFDFRTSDQDIADDPQPNWRMVPEVTDGRCAADLTVSSGSRSLFVGATEVSAGTSSGAFARGEPLASTDHATDADLRSPTGCLAEKPDDVRRWRFGYPFGPHNPGMNFFASVDAIGSAWRSGQEQFNQGREEAWGSEDFAAGREEFFEGNEDHPGFNDGCAQVWEGASQSGVDLRRGSGFAPGGGFVVPAAECTDSDTAAAGPVPSPEREGSAGQPLSAEVVCEAAGSAAFASASATGHGFEVPGTDGAGVSVESTASSIRSGRTPQGQVTVAVASSNGVRVGPLSIGEVRTVAVTTAKGRTGSASTDLERRWCAVSLPGVVDSDGCFDPDDPANEDLVDSIFEQVNAATLQKVQISLPSANGKGGEGEASPGGYQAVVTKHAEQRSGDIAVNDDDSHTVPGLQAVVYNDSSAGRSRLVVQLAGVHAESRYGVTLLPRFSGFEGSFSTGSFEGTPSGRRVIPGTRRLPSASTIIEGGGFEELFSTSPLPENPVRRFLGFLPEALKDLWRLFVQHPLEFLLLFFVFSLLGTPAYLAYRRRTFVGVVAG